MFEPTDRTLRIQGMTRKEYETLSLEGKNLVAERGPRIQILENITLAAQLINAMIEDDPSKKDDIVLALEGAQTQTGENIKTIIRQYLDAKVDTSITDYYRIKYEKTSDVISQAIDTGSKKEEKKIMQSQILKKNTPKQEPQQIEGVEQRRITVAGIVSHAQGRSLDEVMRSEVDVIDRIIEVTDQNRHKGITDEKVVKACEKMMKEGSGVEYIMEALLPQNRQALLEKAGKS